MSESRALTTASNEFALDLYKELFPGASRENLIFSPFSLHTLLGMVGMGAEGDTRDEIFKGLRILEEDSNDNNRIGSAYRSLLIYLLDDGLYDPFTLLTANRIYIQAGLRLKPTFAKELGKYFLAEPQQVDFSTPRSREMAAEEINKWIGSATKHKIKGLINPRTLDDETRLILVNAVYFKGRWEHPFSRQATRMDTFHLSACETVPVNMMSVTVRFPYGALSELDAEAVALPYQGGRLSMLIILPKAVDGLERIQSSIGRVIQGGRSLIRERLSQEFKIHLQMPRFRIEAEIEAEDLRTAFESLGMKSMFSDEAANFDNMTESPNDQLAVSKVLHKAFIEVDEWGTEAAAASAAVMMLRGCSCFVREKIISVLVNRPFYFQIVDQENDDLILFSGHCNAPTKFSEEVGDCGANFFY